MGFYRSLPSVEVGIFSSVSIQSKYMHATTGTTLLPLQLLLLLQCDFRGHPSLIESFNIWMKYMFLLILGWVVNDIPLQLLYGCVPCVTRGISECFIFCRQSFVLCGRGNLPCKRHNKRMHQHTDKYYTTMLGGIMNKDCSESDAVSNNGSTGHSCMFCPEQQSGTLDIGSTSSYRLSHVSPSFVRAADTFLSWVHMLFV